MPCRVRACGSGGVRRRTGGHCIVCYCHCAACHEATTVLPATATVLPAAAPVLAVTAVVMSVPVVVLLPACCSACLRHRGAVQGSKGQGSLNVGQLTQHLSTRKGSGVHCDKEEETSSTGSSRPPASAASFMQLQDMDDDGSQGAAGVPTSNRVLNTANAEERCKTTRFADPCNMNKATASTHLQDHK